MIQDFKNIEIEGIYSINQYPKNKVIDFNLLSEEMKFIRDKQRQVVEFEKDVKTCKRCGIEQPIEEFYLKDKFTGRRSPTCRDCEAKAKGIIEIGKYRFSEKMLEKGFYRCVVCKQTKHLSKFSKNKNSFSGHCAKCKECSVEDVRKLQQVGKKISLIFL